MGCRVGRSLPGPWAIGCGAVLAVVLLVPVSAGAQADLGFTPFGALARGWSLDSGGRVRRAWGVRDTADRRGSAVDRARSFLVEQAPHLSLDGVDRLRHLGTRATAAGTVVRFAPSAHGGPILGASVVVLLQGGRVSYLSLRGAVAASGERAIDRETAIRLALAQRAWRAVDARRAARLVEGRARPVWVVDLAGPRPHQLERVVVDAERGAVISTEDRVRHARGRVFATDPVSAEGETTIVDLPFLTSRDRLTGRYVRVASCDQLDRGCEGVQHAQADSAGDFLYEPEEPSFSDPFAEVHTYHHTNRVASYFREVHDFTWTCGESETLPVLVNYTVTPGEPYDNAGYVPPTRDVCGSLFFGQGQVDFSYDADVVYHEYGHAMVDQTAFLVGFTSDALGVYYDPGAINEGIADYFAATIAGEPRLAEYFSDLDGFGEGALRRLDNSLRCPEDLVGESHYDGRLVGGALWELRETFGAEEADALAFATVAALDGGPSLSDFADLLVATATSMAELGALRPSSLRAVEQVVERRGLKGCVRVVPLDDGVARLGFTGVSSVGGLARNVAPVHYSIALPPDLERMRLVLNRVSLEGTYRIVTRIGAPVEQGESGLISDAEYELDPDGTVLFDGQGAAALPRCDSLYVAVVTEDLATIGAGLFEIRAELERSGAPELCVTPDAGMDTHADGGSSVLDGGPELTPGGGGCSCRIHAHPRNVARSRAAVALGAVALLMIRRRRGRLSL